MKKYCWAYDKNEQFFDGVGDTVEECINEAKINNLQGFDKFYIGCNRKHEIGVYIDIDGLLDSFDRSIEAEVYRVDEWSGTLQDNHIEQLEKELDEVLQKWLKSTGNQPFYYDIINIKEYSLV